MRQLISILTISLFAATQLFAQKEYTTEYEVQYKVAYSMDSTNEDNKQDETVYLYTGSDYGVFMNQNKAKADEFQSDLEKQIRSGGNIVIKSESSNFKKVFYKDVQTGRVLTEVAIANKNFKFNEPKMPLKWTIADSTKTVMDYPAQKATTHFAGRDYVAWFTLNVPIHDGPYLFSGLPGLIVELYDTRDDYHFTLQSLQKLDNPKTWTVPEAKEISKAKFKKLKAKAAKNAPKDFSSVINQKLSSENIDMDNTEVEIKVSQDGRELSKGEMHRMVREMRQAKNNPIELK